MNASAFATRLAGIEAAVGKCADPAPEPQETESTHSSLAPGEHAEAELAHETELASVDSRVDSAEASDSPSALATRIDSLRQQLNVVNEVLRRLI